MNKTVVLCLLFMIGVLQQTTLFAMYLPDEEEQDLSERILLNDVPELNNKVQDFINLALTIYQKSQSEGFIEDLFDQLALLQIQVEQKLAKAHRLGDHDSVRILEALQSTLNSWEDLINKLK